MEQYVLSLLPPGGSPELQQKLIQAVLATASGSGEEAVRAFLDATGDAGGHIAFKGDRDASTVILASLRKLGYLSGKLVGWLPSRLVDARGNIDMIAVADLILPENEPPPPYGLTQDQWARMKVELELLPDVNVETIDTNLPDWINKSMAVFADEQARLAAEPTTDYFPANFEGIGTEIFGGGALPRTQWDSLKKYITTKLITGLLPIEAVSKRIPNLIAMEGLLADLAPGTTTRIPTATEQFMITTGGCATELSSDFTRALTGTAGITWTLAVLVSYLVARYAASTRQARVSASSTTLERQLAVLYLESRYIEYASSTPQKKSDHLQASVERVRQWPADKPLEGLLFPEDLPSFKHLLGVFNTDPDGTISLFKEMQNKDITRIRGGYLATPATDDLLLRLLAAANKVVQEPERASPVVLAWVWAVFVGK
jgi:hypothetical protein